MDQLTRTIGLASEATTSLALAVSFAVIYDCDGNCLNDSNGDGICDELTVMGCTDAEACNYDDCANLDDGSCELPLVLECDGLCPDTTHVYTNSISRQLRRRHVLRLWRG